MKIRERFCKIRLLKGHIRSYLPKCNRSSLTHSPNDRHFILSAVGLLDMSSLSKFIIKGETSSVVSYLQSLCSNDVDIPVGGIIPTGMLNENGMYKFTTNICKLDNIPKSQHIMYANPVIPVSLPIMIGGVSLSGMMPYC